MARTTYVTAVAIGTHRTAPGASGVISPHATAAPRKKVMRRSLTT
jgi:hypothetical protein